METLQIREVGRVKEVKKSIAKIVGLTQCMIGQMIEITSNAKGIIMGFVGGEIIVFLLGRIEEVRVGINVVSHMAPFTIPVGDGYLGRIVNALAEPIDGQGPVDNRPRRVAEYIRGAEVINRGAEPEEKRYPIFRAAPSVMQRVPVRDVLETGNLLIDSMIPIGKGQRELIAGDRMTGKTTIGVDAILNQKGKGVVCVYCCIGRSYSSIRKVVEILKTGGALDYTIIVAAHAASSSGDQYLAPYTACAIGEHFMDTGRDVFVVFDDLTKHAWAYRQLSLLLERPPGRNAYPGDIFYIHSQLMERAGKYSPEFLGGSMTFFPIVDTIEGDVTGYIPSNLISMTDGQIYLSSALFNSGTFPAVDMGLSVSRIGSKVQAPVMRELSGSLRLEYLRYNELVKISRFKANVSEDVNQRLRHGEVLTHLFAQENYDPYPFEKQILLLYAFKRGILNTLMKNEIVYFKTHILQYARSACPGLIAEIAEARDLTPDMRKRIDDCFVAFFRENESALKAGPVEEDPLTLGR